MSEPEKSGESSNPVTEDNPVQDEASEQQQQQPQPAQTQEEFKEGGYGW